MKPFVFPLAGTWWVLYGAGAWAFLGTGGSPSPSAVRLLLSASAFVHVGFLGAISLTEAWLKFRAPLLERHVGFDVGRHIFIALNTIEAVLTSGSLAALWAFVPGPSHQLGAHGAANPWTTPLAMAAVLTLQIGYLTPALELRAFHIILGELEQKKELSRKEEKVLKELKAVVTLKSMPAKSLHHIYVFLEFAKVAALFTYGVRMAEAAVELGGRRA